MEAIQAEQTIISVLPWLKIFLDYTDAVCQALPEDGVEIRPVDPKGGFVFSAKEQVMHIAEERWNFVQEVTGEDLSAHNFCLGYPGKEAPWQFIAATRAEILASLAEGRAKVDALLTQPAVNLLTTTPALVKSHAVRVAKLKAEGKDTAAVEAKGPATLGSMVIFALAGHESGHRAVLQHMLRMNGIDVTRYA